MNILNQTTELILQKYTWGFPFSFTSIFLLVFGICIIIFMCMVVRDVDWRTNWGAGIVFVFILLIGIGCSVISFHTKPVYKEVVQYEVILDDTIPFHDVYDKYEIMEQRGEIFVLRDKGWEDP